EDAKEPEAKQGVLAKYPPEQLAASREYLRVVREETAKLHAGDAENVRLWRMFMPWSMEGMPPTYRRLDFHFDHLPGESFYNPMLPAVVRDLETNGIACRSEGAVVVFLREGEPPAMVQKRDGAFTYTTSDLATIRYRMQEWRPDAILYL